MFSLNEVDWNFSFILALCNRVECPRANDWFEKVDWGKIIKELRLIGCFFVCRGRSQSVPIISTKRSREKDHPMTEAPPLSPEIEMRDADDVNDMVTFQKLKTLDEIKDKMEIDDPDDYMPDAPPVQHQNLFAR